MISKNKFIFVCYLFLFFGTLGVILPISSCSSSGGRLGDNKIQTPDIHDPIKQTGEISTGVKTSADNIDKETQGISDTVKESPAKETVEGHIKNINKETNDLRDYSQDLSEMSKKLEVEQKKIDDLTEHASYLEGDQSKLKKQIEDLKNENKRLLSKMLAWLAAACVAGIGICVFIVFLTQNKLAIFGAIGCAVTMCVAVAVSALMTWIAYVTAGVFVLASIFASYYVWRNIINKKQEIKSKSEEITNKDKAIEEIVQTGELAKKYMSPEARFHVFGDSLEPGKVNHIQSDFTKAVVRKIRDEKITKAEPVPVLFRKISITGIEDPYK